LPPQTFGERVVHGYFLISAAAGLFVDAGVGPVIANYGMENLRFIEPVKPGDTIQVRLTCKRKTVKRQRSAEEKATGVVEWAVEIQPAPAGGALFHPDAGGPPARRPTPSPRRFGMHCSMPLRRHFCAPPGVPHNWQI
jgi:hypothetical protein